jgi:hypothetical protein
MRLQPRPGFAGRSQGRLPLSLGPLGTDAAKTAQGTKASSFAPPASRGQAPTREFFASEDRRCSSLGGQALAKAARSNAPCFDDVSCKMNQVLHSRPSAPGPHIGAGAGPHSRILRFGSPRFVIATVPEVHGNGCTPRGQAGGGSRFATSVALQNPKGNRLRGVN